MRLWQSHENPVGHCACLRLERLVLWIWHPAGEWRLAHRLEDEPQAAEYRPDDAVPEQVEWTRFIDAEARPDIRFRPVMPALPLVVRPEAAMHLLPRVESQLYVGIPVTVRIERPRGEEGVILAEYPVQPLTKTWFGAPDDPHGLLCLALHSRARLTLDGLGPVDPARAVCPMHLKNAADATLEYRSLALLTDHLGIDQGGDGRLWATQVEVTFKGIEADTGIRYLSSSDGARQSLVPLSEPRQPVTESLSRRLLGGWVR